VIKHVLRDANRLSTADLRSRSFDHPALNRVI
jgi:hypothetical protein